MKMTRAIQILLAGTMLSACTGPFSEVPNRESFPTRAESRDYELDAFTSIHLSADSSITITQGEAQRVTVYTEEDHFEELRLSVRGDTLNIRHRDRRHNGNNVHIEITMADLESFEVDGAVNAKLQNLTLDEFELELDGAGTVYISGSCTRAEINISGAANLDARDFHCEEVDVELDGVGSIDVYASEAVWAEVDGVGGIDVWGDPKRVRKSSDGIGGVDIKGR